MVVEVTKKSLLKLGVVLFVLVVLDAPYFSFLQH